MRGAGFAVIDVETTGFSPKRGDRIVEIAIVHVSPTGEIEGVWESLINPGRDVGPTRIHGIEASHVMDAPPIQALAPRILNLLANRAVVAHNFEFDMRFLSSEITTIDDSLVVSWAGSLAMPTICTMRLASEFFPGSPRSLDAICAAAGVERALTHRAAADARDTAAVLVHCWSRSATNRYWADLLAEALHWEFDVSAAADWFPREAASAPRRHFVERIATTAAPIHASGRELDYLGILDRALLDGHLSRTEEGELLEVASSLGLPRTAVEHLHRSYLHRMIAAAWADGVLTPDELSELESLADALRVTGVEFGEPTLPPITAPPVSSSLAGGSFRLEAGDTVVLTGDMTYERGAWARHLASRGIQMAPNASRKVKLVVAADPDSQSGKARRARELQIPIVTEAKLVELVGGHP